MICRRPRVAIPLSLFALVLPAVVAAAANASVAEVSGQVSLKQGWQIQSSARVAESGAVTSRGESKPVTFSPHHFPALNVSHLRARWLAQMGEPELYRIKMEVQAVGSVSDTQGFSFGVREITASYGFRSWRRQGGGARGWLECGDDDAVALRQNVWPKK